MRAGPSRGSGRRGVAAASSGINEAVRGSQSAGRLLPTLCRVLLFCAAPTAAHAQLVPGFPLSVEVRVGGALPTGDFADASPGLGAEAGPHLGAAASIHLLPALAVYGGYSQSWFSCPPCEARGLDDTVADSGFDFGLEAALPLRAGGGTPWLRAGGVLHTLAISGFGGVVESDRALGFRAGAGVAFPLMGSLRVVPGVSYSSYSAGLDLGGLRGRTVDVNHFAAELGLRYTF